MDRTITVTDDEFDALYDLLEGLPEGHPLSALFDRL